MPTAMNRAEFERWARYSVKVLEETDEHYVLQLFGENPIVCPKSDQSVTPCLLRDGMWEAWISIWFMRNIDKDTTFIDIGANCGYYSVLAARECSFVYAFEPNPKYTPLLETTAFLNRHTPIIILPYAVSDNEDGTVLHIPGNLEGSASISSAVDMSGYDVVDVEVETMTLDSFNIPSGKMVIKVDAEGAEEMVWGGSQAFRDRHSPTFVIEYTPDVYSETFVDALSEYGDVAYIDFDGKEVPLDANTVAGLEDWAMLVIRKRS